MSAKKISQREARRLRKRVEQLEGRERDRLRTWGSDYPGGVHVMDFTLAEWSNGRVWMATRLGSVLVGKYDGQGRVSPYAIPTEAKR